MCPFILYLFYLFTIIHALFPRVQFRGYQLDNPTCECEDEYFAWQKVYTNVCVSSVPGSSQLISSCSGEMHVYWNMYDIILIEIISSHK